ncbi:serine/threonine protein kinase [Mycolicibacterium sp. S2-37]|uniref:serine/threonine-protein kinase n=1 Tax=Mycolicibacterium sp. S2-37 TaxID=2810297 RepID=UPI001A94B88F|nr:serine/threonine-protein kinase [Mycolicibacterium sp. S2-37]MBO0680067.1 serine/threonine protein kinase [Mycolicibacterium sp. S2-37]
MSDRELLGERYELRDVLGCGGMAEVRDGWDTRLDRPVAVKLLHPGMRSQADVLARFEVEARSAARLTHPNVVAVHDFGEQDGTPFIVMERLPGRTLADLMARGPMRSDGVRNMIDDVLAALEVAHAAGVLHRDIKPSNILLSCGGDSLKVADFGIAKTGGAAHTLTGQLVGTIAYMSPERITGAAASVADDLYAVGVMAYEALLGRPAFPHDNPVTQARAIIDDPPAPLSAGGAVDDLQLAAVVDRAMAHDPARRFTSAAEMRAALRVDPGEFVPATEALRVPVRPAPTQALSAPQPPRRHRRTRPVLAAAGVLVAFAVAVLSLAAGPFSAPPPPEPVSTSTTVPPPPPPPPAPVAPPPAAVPAVQQPVPQPPVVQPPAPAQQTGPKKLPGNADKGGNGNGHGPKGNGNGRG